MMCANLWQPVYLCSQDNKKDKGKEKEEGGEKPALWYFHEVKPRVLAMFLSPAALYID